MNKVRNRTTVTTTSNGYVIIGTPDGECEVFTQDETIEALLLVAIEMGLSVGIYKEGDRDNHNEHYCCKART